MHRFLIVRLGSLGDVVHAIPTAAALRAHFPDARIDWAVDPRYLEVLDLVRGLDGRVGVDTRSPAALGTVRDLRSARYDAAIDLQGLVKSAVLARAAGADRTIGFPPAQLREPLARFLYTHTPDVQAAHVVFKNLALLEPLGVRGPRVEFPLDNVPTDASEQVAASAGARGYVLINPGAAWPNKRWPPANFGALAAAIRERFELRSVVIWGPGEESLAAAIVEASSNAAQLAPRTAVTDVFALAREARLMISGDTGPLHIAGAVGTPTVSLFGPTDPGRNGPWSPADIALSRYSGCSCHYQRRCRRQASCIDEIGVGEVVAAIERRIRG